MLSHRIDELIAFIQHDLGPLLASEALRAQRAALDDRLQEERRRVGEPLEAELRANHLALVPVQAGATVQPALLPVIDGTPVSPERFRALRAQGAINETEAEQIYTQITALGPRVAELGEHIAAIQQTHRTGVRQLYEQEARRILQGQVRWILAGFPQPTVGSFLAGRCRTGVDLMLECAPNS
jgi:AAA domain